MSADGDGSDKNMASHVPKSDQNAEDTVMKDGPEEDEVGDDSEAPLDDEDNTAGPAGSAAPDESNPDNNQTEPTSNTNSKGRPRRNVKKPNKEMPQEQQQASSTSRKRKGK